MSDDLAYTITKTILENNAAMVKRPSRGQGDDRGQRQRATLPALPSRRGALLQGKGIKLDPGRCRSNVARGNAIAYISRDTDGLHWKKVLEEALGPIDYRTLDNLGNTDDIEIALAWKPDRGLLASVQEPQADRVAGHGRRPSAGRRQAAADVPIMRIMDDGLVGQMSEYAHLLGAAASSRHRQVRRKPARQAVEGRSTSSTPSIAASASWGWARSARTRPRSSPRWAFPRRAGAARPRALPGIETFHGKDGFEQFLARSDILVDVLPLTRDTRGILDAKALRRAAQGRLLHQHGARRPCRRRGAAGGARFRPSRRRRARRLQHRAAAGRPSLLDASQGAGDAAHRRRHQPAHGLARG